MDALWPMNDSAGRPGFPAPRSVAINETRRYDEMTRRDGVRLGMFLRAAARSCKALCFAVACFAAGCSNSGKDAQAQASKVSYDGDSVSTVQEALDQLDARLAKLEQGLGDLSKRVETLEAARGPAPTVPFDAGDVRWRNADGMRRDVATALSSLTSQLQELATAVGSANSALADLKDSVSTLQSYHECPAGSTRVSSTTPGLCVDQHASAVLTYYREAADNCMYRGGRLCTLGEFRALYLDHTDVTSEEPPDGFIAPPPDIPDDDPDLGSVEWMADSDNIEFPDSGHYGFTGLYRSWDNRGTGNPVLDGTPGLRLPYRCCYDR